MEMQFRIKISLQLYSHQVKSFPELNGYRDLVLEKIIGVTPYRQLFSRISPTAKLDPLFWFSG
jgi:hypothetical protein